MTDVIQSLLQLQEAIHRFEVETLGLDPDWGGARVEFCMAGELLDLAFHGDCFDEFPDEPPGMDEDSNYPLAAFLDWLAEPAHAGQVRSLRFSGPDEGGNGVKPWTFDRLLNRDVVFERLRHFEVGLTDGADHNLSVIASAEDWFSEGGTTAALLGRMPTLRSMIVPSAPNEEFFDGPPHPLSSLRLQCGLAHENVITNLARSSRFPELRELDHTEVHHSGRISEASAEELRELFTDVEVFEELVCSPTGRRLSRLVLRGTTLTEEQLGSLHRASPGLQLLHVPQEHGHHIS